MYFSDVMRHQKKPRGEDETTTSASLLESKKAHNEPASPFRRFTSDGWSWELLSLGFSLGCSVALIAILHKYESQPVPQWRYGITLNALISILATAAKGSLLLAVAEAISQQKWLWFRQSPRKLQDISTFDSASRGPWGAFNMLLKINIRDFASLGALITVLALAFDPFIQQVVVYRLQSVPKSTATIGRCQEWSYSPGTITEVDFSTLPLKAAFYNGLFNGNAAQQLTPTCATGNCTWTPLSSLAFCSICENRPLAAVSFSNCITYSDSDGPDITACQCSLNITNYPGLQNFNYTVTSYGSEGVAEDLWMNMAVIPMSQLVSSYRYSDTPVPQFYVGSGPYGGFARVMFATGSNTTTLQIHSTNVTTCAIYPCIKTYDAYVTNGNLVTEVRSSFYDHSGMNYSGFQTNLVFNPPANQVSNTTTNRTFVLDLEPASGVGDLLQRSFTGNSTLDGSFGQTHSSDVMAALFQSSDLGQLMDNVAESLTNFILNSSSVPHVGTAWGMESYVHVRWIWLILPVALAPMSLVFLLHAIWMSSHRELKVWKSSSLASIFHGLERLVVDASNVERESGMDEFAKQIWVRLQQQTSSDAKLDGGNLMLCESQVTPLADMEPVSRVDPGSVFPKHLAHVDTSASQTGSRGEEESGGRQRIPRKPVGSFPGTGNETAQPAGQRTLEVVSPATQE